MKVNGFLQMHHHRRGHSFNGIANSNSNFHDNLDLFSNNRRTHSFDPFHDVSAKMVRLSAESSNLARSEIDDLLSSTEGGKHDYDWLLTPPGTPDFPSSEGESQPTLTPPRSGLGISTLNTNASRHSSSQSEKKNPSRPGRSSSVSRSSISKSSNRTSSIPNTSPAPCSPISIPRSPTAARPSTPTSRPTPSRPSTPSRVRSVPTSSAEKGSRPSTPSTRPHTPSLSSRPSTPTRRHSVPSSTASAGQGRVALNGRNSEPTPISRPSSPSPRGRPIVPPNFPLETPPNLRTTLPDRPISAGRSRPGLNSETQNSRRQSSPVVNRGRLSESAAKIRGQHADVPEAVARRYVKPSSIATDNNGFGRTISKKSLDMAIRHMDIRNGSGTLRSLSSRTLYPQSIRTSIPKIQPTRGLSAPASVHKNGRQQRSNNGACFDNGTNGREIDERQYFAKLSEVDMYESSRYDALLLKEDLKNTNWLHSVDDKCDQGPIFDNGFESLPEPFGIL